MFNKSQFVTGQTTSFVYHEKEREGVVQHVNETSIVLEIDGIGLDGNPKGKVYKSFRYDKMQPRV